MSYKESFKKIGAKVPHIFLPNKNIDLKKFSTIACDQYTSNKEYWEKVKSFVGENVSTLNLIYPEAYLPIKDKDIININNNMKIYIDKNYLVDIGESLIYVERKTKAGLRHGLIIALDLEEYDFSEKSKSLIRATEKTVMERLPVRVKIKENAILDLPHIMVFIDDKENKLFSYIKNTEKEKLYDFDLMFDAGNIKGYKIDKEKDFLSIANILNELKEKSKENLLYAIGDGNHSLAAAKIIYEKRKEKIIEDLKDENLINQALEKEKSRYALVEINNLYDSGIKFYPIHRLLINIDKLKFIKVLGQDIDHPPQINILQPMIDEYLKNHKETTLEYIHDKNECIELGKKENNLSIVYDEYKKDTFFDDIKNGPLCRKCFSTGESNDKRFYLESMLIK